MQAFCVIPGDYAIVRLPRDAAVPEAIIGAPFFSITRTADELSIVCPDPQVPEQSRAERGWRIIQVQGPLPFEQTGVLASFALPLAELGISIFTVSTFDTDYILVRASQADRAVRALEAAGHVRTGGT
jgi:hypothetical protein